MRSRWILAAIMALIGLIFIGQGLGIIRSSSTMTDDIRWAIVGAALFGGSLLVGWSAIRKNRRA